MASCPGLGRSFDLEQETFCSRKLNCQFDHLCTSFSIFQTLPLEVAPSRTREDSAITQFARKKLYVRQWTSRFPLPFHLHKWLPVCPGHPAKLSIRCSYVKIACTLDIVLLRLIVSQIPILSGIRRVCGLWQFNLLGRPGDRRTCNTVQVFNPPCK